VVSALFDTNLLIDALAAMPEALTELQRYDTRAVSIISWIEVMTGVVSTEEEQATRSFLGHFDLLQLTEEIADRAAVIRRERRIKLPDAIIWASAQTGDLLLVTRNEKDFPADDPGVRVPYRV
jgi:predicted nucleic acid-binding protein